MDSEPILRIIALVLVAMGISIALGRMWKPGLARRVLQLALITIVGSIAYYSAVSASTLTAKVSLSFFASVIVGFGTAVTLWSFRGRAWDLVAWALIVLAAACFSPDFLFPGLLSAPGLTAAGVLFLLRRVRLRMAISISMLVMLLMGFVIWMLVLVMSGS